MLQLVDWLLIINSIVLITLVALQSSKQSLGQALTGGNSELFKNQKERGAELFMSRATLVSAILLVVLAIAAIIVHA
ncbi:preprotein translocase subunit SecG [Haloplasma contractile]|uniref:Protein-export membrane protein SecG n=1 Tax=Haloplasma contractile SSD-17B TaxID=1033810 RepID=U2EEA9_9MOLU|nr:preprotein translocase subunit SecG [Haloplasma contractile]ERJ13323.1 putative protein-export membrane protein SecG [Haloplasma contractile SSD-17B]